MVQNLENKMELQINSLETRIKKMQERFNKELEEIKKSQYIMNNAINEIKNTLEGNNSRITEAEDRISEVEGIMVEINETERKKAKQIKRNEISGTMLKKKDHEKILEIIVENFPKMGKEIINHPSPRNPESPKRDKPKAKHPKTHINPINKDETQSTNIKSSKGETTNNTKGDSHKG